MEENKFEKQVQQKMEDLKLEPSDAVWTKIEARLEKRKKPRWAILFLFLFLFICMSGAYWLWNNSQHSSIAKNNSVENSIAKNTRRLPSSNEKDVASKSNSAREPIQKNNNAKKLLATENQGNISPRQKPVSHQKLNKKVSLKIYPGEEEKESATHFKEANEKDNSKIADDNLAIKSYPQNETSNNANVINDNTSVKISEDSLQNKNVVTNKKPDEKDSTKDNTVTTAKSKSSIKNKWKFGLSFTGGISHLNNVSGVNNSYAYLSNPSSANSYPGTIIYNATLKQRPGFSLGIVEEKNISTNTKISIGLNFKTLRSLYKVGNTSGYYSSQNAVHNYNAHINFIELPVSVKVQFVKGKTLPLFWEGGIVLSQIINTNALQFDQYTGKYYLDNSVFNKTQLGLNTSISVGLFAKKRSRLLVGPYFYYGASKIAKEGLYGDKHFVFTGLKAGFIF